GLLFGQKRKRKKDRNLGKPFQNVQIARYQWRFGNYRNRYAEIRTDFETAARQAISRLERNIRIGRK
ncbi:hypothetical protein OFM36_33535, partial [Escherichia coli]|nr:hypothetical protein [Escherichia coli]